MMAVKILIADDEPQITEILKHAFLREGFEVVIASDGRQARELIDKESPAVVILDLMMPVEDGWQVLRWLRQEKKSALPVIIMSAKDEMTDLRASYDLAADHYAVKPVLPQELIKAVRTVMLIKEQST